jgi:DNA polymerase-3 subunit alpha
VRRVHAHGPLREALDVLVVARLDGRREVELKLPGRYRLDGALRGALKSAPGVVLLEDA